MWRASFKKGLLMGSMLKAGKVSEAVSFVSLKGFLKGIPQVSATNFRLETGRKLGTPAKEKLPIPCLVLLCGRAVPMVLLMFF